MGKVNNKKESVKETKTKTETNKYLEIWHNILDAVKKFFSVKRNIIITAIVILIIIILFIIFHNKKSNEFVLNEVYDIYPDEVRELYANFVDVSCSGDMHLSINVDSGAYDINHIPKKDLLNYMFSYLDKNGMLADSITDNVIEKVQRQLFNGDVNLLSEIKAFSYGGNIYDYASGKVTKKGSKCEESDVTYVTHLYGYYWKNDKLSIDIMVGYLKDGTLYTYDDKEMGKYDGDASKLSSLMEPASYYRISYIRYDQNKYKLSSVEWRHKS